MDKNERDNKDYNDFYDSARNGSWMERMSSGMATNGSDGPSRSGFEDGCSDRSKYGPQKKEDSDSNCYLTTACVGAMQLPDNCLELTVLRNFRDRVLLPSPTGRKAVKEYYQIAPEIVEVIKTSKNSTEILKSLYGTIRHSAILVLAGNYNGAFEHYKQMTLDLRKRLKS